MVNQTKTQSANKMKLKSKYDQLDETNFNKMIRKDSRLRILEFGSEWCGSCQIMEPVLIYLINKYGDEIVIVKIDMETSYLLVNRFRIYTRPTYLFFREGKIVDFLIGTVSKNNFENKIKIQLSNHSIYNNLKRRLK